MVKKNEKNEKMENKKNIYELEKQFRKNYSNIKLQNFFLTSKYPRKEAGLTFGFICPGAINTLKYLNTKVRNSKNDKVKGIVSKIKLLTDFQFFIEIIAIYNQYLVKSVYNTNKKQLGGKYCEYSNIIVEEITNLFNSLPLSIKNKIPDNFYHIRHDTLICSKDKSIAKKRIKLIQGMYLENFTDISVCEGKRDGVSGCRDCCSQFQGAKYNECVSNCMRY